MRLPVAITGLILAVIVICGGCRRKADVPVVAGPESQDLAPAEAVPVVEPVAPFDREVHEAALVKLAPVHHERIRVAMEARAALDEYAKSKEGMSPEALEQDEQWQKLNVAAVAAEAAREEARVEIASRIRDRMRQESKQHLAEKEAAAASVEAAVPPVQESNAAVADPADQTYPADPTHSADPAVSSDNFIAN